VTATLAQPDLRSQLLDIARGPDGRWAANPQAAEARRLLTRRDPQLFAAIYLSKHLRGPETGDRVSFSAFHLAMYADAEVWMQPTTGPAEDRVAYVAPRGAAKSTLAFLVLPMWAAAHLHIDFIAAFADSATQAELHLTTFKRELDTNELLRHDFPDLVTPARRPGGSQVQDNRGMYLAESGFVFAAKGIDSSSLGMKVGERRPRLLLLDDIEPDESNYSAGQKEKRLATIREAVFPLNLNARVVMVGTTTMHGSVMHDVVRQATDPGACPEWVAEENILVRYFPAIVTLDDGTESSLWPERWSLEFLQSIRHTRSYQKNYLNRPVSLEGGFWSPEHFRYDVPAGVSRRILSIDPAGTSRSTSDYTGLAVVGFSPVEKRAVVLYSAQVKLTPAGLREKCLSLISRFDVHGALVETNSGGDAWPAVLNLPVKVVTLHQTEPKQVRASQVLDYYEAGWVAHDGPQTAFEDQAVAFPHGAHDDVVDAVGSGVHLFLKDRRSPSRRRESTASYA
jgi:phage terminase large subunit-like protein